MVPGIYECFIVIVLFNIHNRTGFVFVVPLHSWENKMQETKGCESAKSQMSIEVEIKSRLIFLISILKIPVSGFLCRRNKPNTAELINLDLITRATEAEKSNPRMIFRKAGERSRGKSGYQVLNTM